MSRAPGRPAGAPEPTWEVAYLFPPQGGWEGPWTCAGKTAGVADRFATAGSCKRRMPQR
jgi:hypothetical protein